MDELVAKLWWWGMEISFDIVSVGRRGNLLLSNHN